jgi:2,4-dienoyl-CoA reductase-like NADH-dependent reductase (Old Yellow Enzyme family)
MTSTTTSTQTSSTATGLDLLGSPFELPCGSVLANRIAKSALSEAMGTRDHAPTENLVRLYERWSSSGAGLLITGNVMVDRRALGEAGNVVVEDDRDAEMLARWAEASTRHGAQAWVQLNHPGRQSPRTLTRQPVAPSAIGVTGTGGAFARPRALTTEEIHDLIRRFAVSARTVVEAGFTGVQIHGAHGYLVSQFLSPRANVRTDEWGGTPENRRRFLIEVVRAIRAEIGAGVPLGVKLNSADFQRGGFTEEESLLVVLALADEGVDLLEISGGTYESAAMMGVNTRESTRAREAYFLDYAEKVRAATDIPLMVTGGFRTAAGMTDALESGAVDIVGIGRPMALEPGFPAALLSGAVTASHVRPRGLGIAKLDGATEIAWYGQQLRRIGAGKSPNPNQHPAETLARYVAGAGIEGIFRKARRGL